MNLKELFPKIDIRNIKGPTIRLFLLCAVYNAVYLMIQVYLFERQGLFMMAVNALSILSSLGFYYFCVKTWDKKFEFDFTRFVYVIGLQAVYIGLIQYILMPVHTFLASNQAGYILIQIICALLLFVMIPLQLFLYRALSEGITELSAMKSFIVPLVKDNYKEILNQYLAILLIVLLIDVLFGGQISASGVSSSMIDVEQGRINALSVCMNTLYVANPWMMFAVGILAVVIYPVNIVQSLIILCIYMGIGIALSLLEIGYIQFIGDLRIVKKKKKNGTKKTKTNR